MEFLFEAYEHYWFQRIANSQSKESLRGGTCLPFETVRFPWPDSGRVLLWTQFKVRRHNPKSSWWLLCHSLRWRPWCYTNRLNRISIRDEILTAVKTSSSKRIDILLWISIPCTGGTTWSYVNLQHESARLKVEYHRLVFDKIWAAMVDFVNIIRHLSPIIAIEWPSNCVYWKFERVMKFCQKHKLKEVTFDGCMIGIKDHNNVAIKKPWKIMTSCDDIIRMFSELKCDNQHEHVQGRGEDLKNTEQYSYDMTGRIHSAFVSACGSTSSHPTFVLAAVRSFSSVTDMSYRAFPEATVKEADYSAAAEAAGLVEFNDQGEPVERPRRTIDGLTNGDQWRELLEEIFHTTSTCRVVNESTEIEHLGAMVDQSDPGIAQENLTAISPHDASLLAGTTTFSVRAMACPGEPEVNFLFTGDSFMSLVDLEGGKQVSRRNVGEYIQQRAKDFLPEKTNHVRREMRWGKGLPQILDAIDHGLLQLRQKGTSRPCIIVVAYAGNDIYGANGFVDCDWIDQGSASYSQRRRDAASKELDRRVDLRFECLNKLVALTKRPEVGNIVMIMPWFGRGFNLHPNYDAQMIREANVLRKKGICVLDGTSLVKATNRFDSFHAANTDHNRLQYIRFFSSAARLGYSLFRLRSCEPLMKHSERRRELLAEEERQRSAAVPEWDVDGYLMYVKEMRPTATRREGQNRTDCWSRSGGEPHCLVHCPVIRCDPGGFCCDKEQNACPSWATGGTRVLPWWRTWSHRGWSVRPGDWQDPCSTSRWESPWCLWPGRGWRGDRVQCPECWRVCSCFEEAHEDGCNPRCRFSSRRVRHHQCPWNRCHSGQGQTWAGEGDYMISAASATTIRRFELAAGAADADSSAVKEEVDYEGDDEGTPGVGELAIKPPPKKVAKTEAKMPMPRGTVAGFLAKEVASEVLKYTEVETAEQGTNTTHSGGKYVPPTTKVIQGPLQLKPTPPLTLHNFRSWGQERPTSIFPKHVQEAEAMAKAVVASKSTAAPKIAAPPPPQEQGGRPSGSSVPPKARPVQPMATTAAGGTPSTSAGASSSDTSGAKKLIHKNPPGYEGKAAKVPKIEGRTGGKRSSSVVLTPRNDAAPPRDNAAVPRSSQRWDQTGIPIGSISPLRDVQFKCKTTDLPAVRAIHRLSDEEDKVSRRATALLRGYDAKNFKPYHRRVPPEVDDELYIGFEAIYQYCKRRNWNLLSRETMYQILKSERRFACIIQAGRPGELTPMGLPFLIKKVKAIQGHEQSLLDRTGDQHVAVQIITCDREYGHEELAAGKYPRSPSYPHLLEGTVPSELKIIYHYTGIFPGVGSGKGHCYAARYSPWEVDANDPGARANRPICFAIDVEQLTHYGARVLVSDSGALLIPEWIPNHVIMWGFDCGKNQLFWSNFGYLATKKHTRERIRDIKNAAALGWDAKTQKGELLSWMMMTQISGEIQTWSSCISKCATTTLGGPAQSAWSVPWFTVSPSSPILWSMSFFLRDDAEISTTQPWFWSPGNLQWTKASTQHLRRHFHQERIASTLKPMAHGWKPRCTGDGHMSTKCRTSFAQGAKVIFRRAWWCACVVDCACPQWRICARHAKSSALKNWLRGSGSTSRWTWLEMMLPVGTLGPGLLVSRAAWQCFGTMQNPTWSKPERAARPSSNGSTRTQCSSTTVPFRTLPHSVLSSFGTWGGLRFRFRTGRQRRYDPEGCVNSKPSCASSMMRRRMSWTRTSMCLCGSGIASTGSDSFLQPTLMTWMTAFRYFPFWKRSGIRMAWQQKRSWMIFWTSSKRMSPSHWECARELVADHCFLSPINLKGQPCIARLCRDGRTVGEEIGRQKIGTTTTPSGLMKNGSDGAPRMLVTHTVVTVGQHLAIGDLGTEQSRRELLAIAEMRESGLYFALIRLPSVRDSWKIKFICLRRVRIQRWFPLHTKKRPTSGSCMSAGREPLPSILAWCTSFFPVAAVIMNSFTTFCIGCWRELLA